MKKIMKKIPVTLLVTSLTTQMALAADPADRVLKNADVYTVDAKNPNAQAIAIDDGKIVFVGSNDKVAEYIGKDTKVDDLKGKFVLPGFIDTHAHFALGAAIASAVKLDESGTPESWAAEIKKFADANPDAPAILGLGFAAAAFGKDGPTKEMLDKVVPNRPAVIIDEGGHSAWFNSKALEMAGITKDTPDPVPGVHMYKRNAKGEPSGYNMEAMTIYPLMSKLKLLPPELIIKGGEQLFPMLPSLGLTAYYDAGMMQMEDMVYPALASLEKAGKLPVKVTSSYIIQSPSQIPTAIEKIKGYKAKYQSALIRPNTIKIHNDGTMEAKTAALLADYTGDKGNKGGILLSGDVLKNFVADIAREDLNVHIHAIGDKTVSEGLDAVEYARKQVPNTKSRFAMAHVILTQDKDVPRFGGLDVVAQTTPAWMSQEDEVNPNLGEARSKQRYRIKSMEDGGAKVTFGSDFPVGGKYGLVPLNNIEVGMTRKGFDEGAKSLGEEGEKMSLESMIKGYTINAAYQLGMEKEIGSLTVGKAADIVVLDENLFKIKPTDIHNVKVDMTIMNGKTTYSAQ
ncbi:MAG: hydrolase [Rhodobacterales bacterium]|nr:MAG: hydrolase [Rhodobacterales bacterium]